MERAEIIYEQFLGIGEGLAFFDVLSERDYRGLLRLPASLYKRNEYKPDPEKQYPRGYVLKMPGDNISKYVATNDNIRIPNNRPPGHPEQRDFRLVRNMTGKFRYIREEFLERGAWRWWDTDPNRQEQHGWYELTAQVWSENQEPWQNPQAWAYKGKENPPD